MGAQRGARAMALAGLLLILCSLSVNAQAPASTSELEVKVEKKHEEISEELREIWDADVILKKMTRRKKSELPVVMPSVCEEDEQHLDAADKILNHIDTLHQNYSISNVGLMALISKAQVMIYSEMYTQRYDYQRELNLASGPAVNQEQCIKQLENLNTRYEKQLKLGYRTNDVNLFQLLDTWGHKSAGILVGRSFMEGMYHECLRLKIVDGQGQRLPTRYCTVALKHNDWPQIDRFDALSLQAGVCLPKTCDSSNYKNKHELIMRLLMTNMRPIEQNQMKFNSLYCLPDEDSPLRSIRNSPQATLMIACLAAWLLLLAFCTYKHHKMRPVHEGNNTGPSSKHFGMSNMNSKRDSIDGVARPPKLINSSQYKFYKMLSITHNVTTLFETSNRSSLMELKLNSSNGGATKSSTNDLDGNGRKIVDLRCVEGIKIIVMCYVIVAHVLLCMTSIVNNGREMSGNKSVAFFMVYVIPAFSVNAFFTITGVLTCYLMFKQNQSQPFITSPFKWGAFMVYRYMRIVPMYALTIWYCKTLAKYTGSGPLWDYGTSAISQRRACEQEPWFWAFLFAANFKSPLEHCIPGGWYLANDFQFFLITPFLLALLYKRPKLGQATLYGLIVLGYWLSFFKIFLSKVDDLRPIATFEVHGGKMLASLLSDNYTQPQNRIPAYLIGLLIGYKLFQFEQARLEFRAAAKLKRRESIIERKASRETKEKESLEDELLSAQDDVTESQEFNWSANFRRNGISFCLLIVLFCCALPLLSPIFKTLNKFEARLLVSLGTPCMHIMFAIAVGLYLLLATTHQGNPLFDAFMSSNSWKPLSRVSLSVLLVNVEVINYIIQSNVSTYYVANQYLMGLYCVCVLATYAVAIIVCALFEAPLRAALNTLLTYAVSRFIRGRKPGKQAGGQTAGTKDKLV